jgi:transcriptional regulator with XRE-family HTH domain
MEIVTSTPTGDALRAARLRRSLGVRQLGRLAGLSRTSVWRVEADRPVAERTRRALAHALGVPLDEGVGQAASGSATREAR